MMHSHSYHQLLNRGRKAGLSARELNQALTMRPVLGSDQSPGQSDCNGYVSEVDARGYRSYRQAGDSPRN